MEQTIRLEQIKQDMTIMITAIAMVFHSDPEFTEVPGLIQWEFNRDGLRMVMTVADDEC